MLRYHNLISINIFLLLLLLCSLPSYFSKSIISHPFTIQKQRQRRQHHHLCHNNNNNDDVKINASVLRPITTTTHDNNKSDCKTNNRMVMDIHQRTTTDCSSNLRHRIPHHKSSSSYSTIQSHYIQPPPPSSPQPCIIPRGGGSTTATTSETLSSLPLPTVPNLEKSPTATTSPPPPPSIISTLVKLRRTIFPIYGTHEVYKFLLIAGIKFFVVMALTLTRDLKDTLVVTQCGAEAIAFLKIYGVLPCAASFIALYSKMASHLPKKTLFYTTCIPFFLFFILFDTLIYPNAHQIQPSLTTVQSLLGSSSSSSSDVISRILTNWTSALYYIIAEIYSSVSIGLLFWQYANEVVSVKQAKRFYPLFAQMSALAPIVSGQYAVRFASTAKDFEGSLRRLTMAITGAGVMVCVFYYASNVYIEKYDDDGSPTTQSSPKNKTKKKNKPTMIESARFLASSQYLRLISTLVIGYGLSINFTEVLWKSLVKKRYPDPLDYQRFMGNFSSAVGLSTCIVIFLGVHVIRLLGWRVGALATPCLMSLLAVPFFGCILSGLDGERSLGIAVAFGTAQSLLSKTAKYALFDPTTQMAYIPLDEESKVKGKAAIDVLGSRVGKSGGSLVQQGLVMMFGTIVNAAPAVVVIYYGVLMGWIVAANQLGMLFLEKTTKEVVKAGKGEGKEGDDGGEDKKKVKSNE